MNSLCAIWISDPDLASVIGLTRRQLFNLRMSGVLGFVKFSGRVFYKVSQINEYMEKNYLPPFAKK